jgi:hypothetical protein
MAAVSSVGDMAFERALRNAKEEPARDTRAWDGFLAWDFMDVSREIGGRR